MRKWPKSERGFSLIELMVVVAILTVVMGVVFAAIANVQKRYRTEEGRVDTMQNAREFVDQIARDIHNTGYPTAKMYTTTPADASITFAKGLAAVSKTDIWFEGDLDNSGQVSSVRYQLQADANGKCPCTLRRSSVTKTAVSPTSQATSFSAEVEGVVNSIGGSSPWGITGTAPNGTANDTVYASYKADPVFSYLDANGSAISVPDDLSSSNLANGSSAASNVAVIMVTLNVLGRNADLDTGRRPVAPMRATLKVPNK